MTNTPKKSGRPKLTPKRKKKRYDVFLIEDDYNALVAKFGVKTPLTLACRAHLISEPTNTEAIETIKQIKELTKNF